MKENNQVGWYVFSTETHNQDHLFLAEIVGTSLNPIAVLVRSHDIALDLWGSNVGDAKVVLKKYIVRKATELEIALC